MSLTMPETVLVTDPAWVWAIFAGIRPIENRARPSPHRGPLLVQSTADMRLTPHVLDWIRSQTWYCPPDLAFLETEYAGRVFGRVEMIGCCRPDKLPEPEREFAAGPFCYRLRRPEPFVNPVLIADCVDMGQIDHSLEFPTP